MFQGTVLRATEGVSASCTCVKKSSVGTFLVTLCNTASLCSNTSQKSWVPFDRNLHFTEHALFIFGSWYFSIITEPKQIELLCQCEIQMGLPSYPNLSFILTFLYHQEVQYSPPYLPFTKFPINGGLGTLLSCSERWCGRVTSKCQHAMTCRSAPFAPYHLSFRSLATGT